jgi:NADP-dependent 3-hydroxy acid dehydrogenase YdfG
LYIWESIPKNQYMTKRLILITGGSSGIGKATAAALHAQGDSVLLQARNLDKLQAAAHDIDPTGKHTLLLHRFDCST